MKLIDIINETEEGVMVADGFEDAIIGVGHRCGQPRIVAYNRKKCIEILMMRDGMSLDDAEEFFQFNTEGSWVGDGTPIFIETYEDYQ